eukprot:COSAG02_NODE_1878_length_10554_cov_95.091918_2_plen_162_part_00
MKRTLASASKRIAFAHSASARCVWSVGRSGTGHGGTVPYRYSGRSMITTINNVNKHHTNGLAARARRSSLAKTPEHNNNEEIKTPVHKKSDAAQIASEQQQNAVLHTAQRFAPPPHTQTATTPQSVTLPPATPSHARTQRKRQGCNHAQHRGSTRRATQHR